MTNIDKLVQELESKFSDVLAYDIRQIINYLHSRGYLEALQSPSIPVIEGLEESIPHLIWVRDLCSREAEKCRIVDSYTMYEKLKYEKFKDKSNMFQKCVKACEEYSKLQKGAQKDGQ